MFDLSTGQSQQVGAHDAPIRSVRWVEAPTGGILATGSWDKTVKVGIYDSASLLHLDALPHVVLGSTIPESNSHRQHGRARLHDGHSVPFDGGGDCRTPHTDHQSQLSYNRLQG